MKKWPVYSLIINVLFYAFVVQGMVADEPKDLNVRAETNSPSLAKKIGGTGLSLVPMVVAGVLGYLAKKEYKDESYEALNLKTDLTLTVFAERGRILPLKEETANQAFSSYRARGKDFNALDLPTRNSMLIRGGDDFKESCEITINGAGKVSVTKLLHQETQRPNKSVDYSFGGTSQEKFISWNKRFTIAVAAASACLIGAGIIGLIAVWKDDIAHYFAKDNNAQPTITPKGMQ